MGRQKALKTAHTIHKYTFCIWRPVTQEKTYREMKNHKPTNPIYCEQLRDFKTYLETLGYQPGTINMLLMCVKEFLGRMDGISIQEVTQRQVLTHHEYLQQRPNRRKPGGLSEMMVHHHLYSLRVFFDWLQQSGRINRHPMSRLKFRRPKTLQRETFTKQEVQKLYASCSTWKERAVLHLFYGCGLRRNEGVRLNLEDVKFKENVLYVREGKGGKSRIVPMSEKVREELQGYCYRERKPAPGERSFMINTRGLRMSGLSYNRLLKDLLQKSGIDKAITLHSLRHSIATHLLDNGLPVEYVRDFLGHKHIESTQVYTRVNQKQFRRWN